MIGKSVPITKVDLVMWSKNGATLLPSVLKRIDEVIPYNVVDKKIFVDDNSQDRTVSIARNHGWQVLQNKKGGVGAGASLALANVTNDYFISFEQDVLLARDWWSRIPKHLEGENVAAAQGWRISNHPVIGKIDEYSMERFRTSLCSIDNTIYKTKTIRELGGFPEHLKYTGVDAYIHQAILNAGFRWITDNSIISIHLRKGGLKEQLGRYYLYGMDMTLLARENLFIEKNITSGLKRSASIALFSPIRGLEIAVKKNCPQATYFYPLIRFAHLAGCLKRELE